MPELIVFAILLGIVALWSFGIRSILRTSKHVRELKNGTLFPGFIPDAILQHSDEAVAANWSSQEIALINIPYDARSFVTWETFVAFCTIPRSEIHSIEVCGTTDGQPTSYRIRFNRRIPPDNVNHYIVIDGDAPQLKEFFSSIRTKLQVPFRSSSIWSE